MALTRSIGAYDDGTALVPGVGTTPLDTRKSLSALWASAGVVAGGPSPLVTGTTGFAYSVAGPVPFVTTRGPSDGFHMFTNDGAVTVPIVNALGVATPGAPGSGLQRIDIVWVQHRTNTENSDTTSAPRFGVESGAAVSSSPVAPSLPAGALELARNTMLSTATSTSGTGNSIAQTAAVAAMRSAPREHAEFTASTTSIPSATTWGAGVMTIDSATSTTPAIATGSTDHLTVTNPGVYAVSFYGKFNVALSGRSFLNIAIGIEDVAQSSLASGENGINTSIPNLACAAGTVITFACMQSSGGLANMTSRIRLTKISD